MPEIELIAHRGTGKAWQQSQSPPENTLPAFQQAWDGGFRSCELDIRCSEDGHAVVIHDATTARTTDGDVVVAETALAVLQRLDAGSWKGAQWRGVRIPTLGAVLDALPEDGRLYVEIKTGPGPIVDALVAALRSRSLQAHQITVISFVWQTVCAVRAALPAVNCYLLVEFSWNAVRMQWDAMWCESGDDHAAHPVYQRPAVLDELIEKVHSANLTGLDVSTDQPADFGQKMKAAGLPWVAWTISDPRTALEMVHRGAVGLTTDQPDLIRVALQRNGFSTR